jgi:hypothetical protein
VIALADAGLVDKGWQTQPYGGDKRTPPWSSPSTSGNRSIRTWKDMSSRASRSSPEPVQLRLGEVERARRLRRGATGKSDKQARVFVQTLFKHVVSQVSSGRNAINTFLAKGGVLLTYEE